jgi:protein TonB
LDCFVDSEGHRGPHPKAIYTPDPDYSEEAREAKLEGTVRLGFTVAKDGSVHNINVIKSLGKGLDEKAVAAVEQWRFEPVVKDGQPVETTLQVNITFRLY